MDISVFRSNLKSQLQQKKMTLNSLASLSDLSEDTLRSVIYGKSQDIKLSTVVKIADVLDCPLDDLIGRQYYSELEREIHKRMHQFSQCSIQTMEQYLSFEEELILKKSNEGRVLLPVFVPTGNMKDGMYCGMHSMETIDISEYPLSLQNDLDFGIKILTNAFEPVYFLNEVLLCTCKRSPQYNDIVLFYDENGRLFLRKYLETHLEPLNGFGERIPSSSFSDYIAKGIVLRTVKEFDIEQYR